MKGLWMMVACLYLDIFTLDSLSTPFVFWRTSQTGSGRRRDFGHANLWPAAMAGEHAKLGVRLNKTFDSRCFQFAAGISTRNIKEWDRLFFGFKLKVYHQYPGYLHTRREKLPLLLWPSNWIYWFTFDISLCEIIWGGIVVCRIIFRKWWELVS